MKLKLKTVTVSIIGIALLAVIGGETLYIVNSKKDLKNIAAESTGLKSNLTQLSSELKEKEDQINAIQSIVNGKNTDNSVKEEKTSEKEVSNNKRMMDVVGKYSSKIKFSNDSQDNTLFSDLELGKDGTYHYRQSIYAEQGEFGNWYIDENGDIILNKLFAHSSDAALRMSQKGETKKISINDDGTLTDSNKKFKGSSLNDLSKIVLNKESSNSDFKLFETIDSYRKQCKQEGYDYLIVGGD